MKVSRAIGFGLMATGQIFFGRYKAQWCGGVGSA